MSFLRGLVDYKRANSPALRFRQRRFRRFLSLLSGLPRPLRILDVGGTEVFWRTLGLVSDAGVEITTLNIDMAESLAPSGVTAIQGDARDLSRFPDRFFDVVFSNSLIEHVGNLEDQARAAREIRRVAKAYFVQTPNRHFPLEPHFMFPFFQYLPVATRVYLLTHFDIGWTGKMDSPEEARQYVQSIQLLDRRSFRNLFPTAQIWDERAFGLVKSFVAYEGFPPPLP